MTTLSEPAPPDAAAPARPGFARVILPICTAHFFSHFFQFLMPPLFPLLKLSYGVSFTELGLLVTAYYGASGFAQTPAGFIVDRFGARRVLVAGLLLLAVSFALVATAPPFPLLLPLMALAGLGNSVFHPADYSMMSALVAPHRVGRAFSFHAVSATLGYAAAPVSMLALASVVPWNEAVLVPALAAGATGLYFVARRGDFDEMPKPHGAPESDGGGIGALLTAPVVACFAFFVLSALPGVGNTAFLAPALSAKFDTAIAVSATAITSLLAGTALGVLIGGWLADRTRRHTRIVVAGLLVAAALILSVTLWPVPAALLIAAFGLAGLASGTTGPSRDMVIRAAASEGRTGRVFGFVYSGYDFGSATVPLLLGAVLDHGAAGTVTPLIAAGYAAMIVAVLATGRKKAAGRRD